MANAVQPGHTIRARCTNARLSSSGEITRIRYASLWAFPLFFSPAAPINNLLTRISPRAHSQDPQPDGCSNDVFVFDLGTALGDGRYITFSLPIILHERFTITVELKTWCRPALGGDLPLPRSG